MSASVMPLRGEAPRYEGGLHDLGNGTHAWIQPNGTWGESNAGLVVGEGESLLVDTLWDVRLTRRMLEEMAPRTRDAAIRTVVNTHSDGDHWWGNEVLASARIVTSEPSAAIMREQSPAEMTRFEKLGAAMRAAGRLPVPKRELLRTFGAFVGELFEPFEFGALRLTPAEETFSGELKLNVGGTQVRVIQVGPAHTPGDAIVHVPSAGVIFAADVLFLESTPVMWAGPVQNWLAALDTIDSLEAERVVPGHGPITDAAGVELVRGYWRLVEPALRTRHEAGMTATEAAREVATSAEFRASPYASWDAASRIVISADTMWRGWEGRTGPPNPRELTALFMQVALLERDIAPPA